MDTLRAQVTLLAQEHAALRAEMELRLRVLRAEVDGLKRRLDSGESGEEPPDHPAADEEPLVGEGLELFEALRKWRRSEAERRGVPPWGVFGDKTLRELVRVRPATIAELRGIYGIGDAKLRSFGTALLAQLSAG